MSVRGAVIEGGDFRVGGELWGLKPPPPSKLTRCVTQILTKILASFKLILGKMGMQRHHYMNLTSLNMKRGRYGDLK